MPKKNVNHHTVESLSETLLNSINDAWRDDAAEMLASCKDAVRAEQALFQAITSPKLDDSLRRACAESLVTIWIRSGYVAVEKLEKLTGVERQVVDAFLREANMLPSNINPP